MRKYINIILASIVLSSCLNDDFLQKDPLNKQTEGTVFITSENFKTYAWQFYGWFPGYPSPTDDNGKLFYDVFSDNGFYASTGSENPYAWDKKTIPTTGDDAGWKFDRIRTINVMLDNIDQSQMSDQDKKHWRGVGYFFKAWDYFNLLNRFGDVTWVENAINEHDDEIIYGSRSPRKEIATKILDMLLYARDNIKASGDGQNTINPDVVNALISRFGLFEGTWQKYHKTQGGDPNKYLNASFSASETLIEKYPSVHASYDELFNSKDLLGNKEVLLCKVYLPSNNLGNNLVRYARTSESRFDVCAEAVQSYLCSDGKPIWTSNVFEGDKTTGDAKMNVEFRNRDQRLYFTVAPPYKINTPVPTTLWTDPSCYTNTDNPDDKEYIDLMNQLISGTSSSKMLPLLQWQIFVVREVPHFRTNRYNMGQGYNVSESGYYVWKYYIQETQVSAANIGDIDAPLFRIGEVMVNHAEAAWELNRFDQGVADKTINVLRKRAKVADMNVSEITAGFDPKRDKGRFVPTYDPQAPATPDYEVDPILWEIRRERRSELFAEGFRYDDLRRWRKGHYINKQQVGVYIEKSDYEDSRHVSDPDISKFAMKLDRAGDAGRVVYFGVPNPGWLEKYYLYPLSVNDLSLNENLTQNPGYPRGN